MASSGWASTPGGRSRWLYRLVICIIAQFHLAKAQTAVSTLFVPNSNTTIAINIPPGSDDINFFISAPDSYQYVAIGFGSSMADALMLVMYASADHKGVTVSPRLSTGNTEPVWSPKTKITLDSSSTITSDFNLVANGTCHNCRRHTTASETPMIFAVGPNLPLDSDDPDARLRRHIGYGHFTLNLTHATGPGGIPSSQTTTTSGASMSPDSPRRDSGSRAATAHGILYAIVALAVAPLDSLVAGITLAKPGVGGSGRWSWMHGVTAGVYFAFVLGAMVPGVVVSREHVATQQFRTGHQVLGLLTIIAMTCMVVFGGVLSYIKRSAKNRGQEPPESTRVMGTVHRWVGRLIWVLFLVNVGLGLKLSEHKKLIILGYAVLAAGLVVILTPVFFCIWRCRKRQGKKDEGLEELHTIYDHNYRN